MKRPARLALTASAIAALLVGGAAVVGTAPDNDGVLAPFASTVSIGQPVSAREFDAVVHGVTLAKTVSAEYSLTSSVVTSPGYWVIVDLTMTAHAPAATLSFAQLRIGDYSYSVSDFAPAPSMIGYSFGSEVPVRGPLVFELPASAFERADSADATLVLPARQSPVLDTVPTVAVDLARLVASAADSVALDSASTPDAGGAK